MNLKLLIPTYEQMSYRKQLLEDPATMDYNKGYNLDFEGYHKETGCFDFPESEWRNWYDAWIGVEPERYYAYIYDEDKDVFVGDVCLHYDEKMNSYGIGIVIEGKYRGKGYSKEGLKLLMDKAFRELDVKSVYDDFEVDRVAAYNLFINFGFKILKKEGNIVYVELKKEDYI